MKTDNRGFTLTELIVCIVIFSIVLLAVFGFMVAGARSYSNVDSRVARQLKSQLALGQIGASNVRGRWNATLRWSLVSGSRR